MRPHLPSLSMLRAFEAVVRLGSVNAAGQELGRTHGAVSKQIRALQLEVGASLFDKVGAGLRANQQGRRLAEAIGDSLDELADRYAAIVGEARAPALHVACSATFAMTWLVPRLPGFSRLHPEVRLRLSMTSAREMRDDRDADLVILWDRGAYPPTDQARAIRLADAAFGVVAAPGYPAMWEGSRRLLTPCRIDHDHTTVAWDRWQQASSVEIVAGTAVSFPHTHLCLGAAVAGMGVAVAERRLAAADIAAGRLKPLSDLAAFADGFAALPHAQRPLSPTAERFLAWLSEELAV